MHTNSTGTMPPMDVDSIGPPENEVNFTDERGEQYNPTQPAESEYYPTLNLQMAESAPPTRYSTTAPTSTAITTQSTSAKHHQTAKQRLEARKARLQSTQLAMTGT